MRNDFGKIVELADLSPLFRDDMTILFGGFGGVGTPPGLVDFILESGWQDLTLIGNDAGFPEIGIGKLVTAKRAKKMIVSHIGSNPNAGNQMHEQSLDIEFSPQGILMERIRAGGYGIPAILSDIAVDHPAVNMGKQTLSIDGEDYLIERCLRGDVSIVYAKAVDEYGNCIYDKSARNTNPIIATASDVTIVEAEEIVSLGELDPEQIVTPGVHVDYIVKSKGVNWKWAWERT